MTGRRVFGVLLSLALGVSTLSSAPAASAEASRRQPRIDPELTQLEREQSQRGHADARQHAETGVIVQGDYVTVMAVPKRSSRKLQHDLERLGLLHAGRAYRLVTGTLPISSIDDAGRLASLAYMTPDRAMVANTVDQGDHAQLSDVARTHFAVDGTGSTVGILSDSFDCLGGASSDVASADLPPGGVQVLEEESPCSGADEGRAMAQIVHDVAPGAAEKFHTAFNGETDFAQGIRDLQIAGAKTIVDDIFYFAEPWYSDGDVAQAVDGVSSAGVSYFSSAGNQARDAYEGRFRPVVDPTIGAGQFMDFDPRRGASHVDTRQRIEVLPHRTANIGLQWADPFGTFTSHDPRSDLDFFAYDPGGSVIFSSILNNSLSHMPFERITISNTSSVVRPVDVVVKLVSGPAPKKFKWVDFNDSTVIDDFDSHAPTVEGHANAKSANAVGAAWYEMTPEFGVTPALLEPYSSASGTQIFFSVTGTKFSKPKRRKTLRFVAPDGADTTFFGGSDPDSTGKPNFFGTSAAAPHAAGVAALAWQSDPRIDRFDICNALAGTAHNMGTRGFDRDSGFGFIDANRALGALHPHSSGRCRKR